MGSIVVGKLTRPAVQKMADAIAAGKTAGTFKTKARGKAVVEGGTGTAARVVELLGGIWTWAEKRGLASGVKPGRIACPGEAPMINVSSEELATKAREESHQNLSLAMHYARLAQGHLEIADDAGAIWDLQCFADHARAVLVVVQKRDAKRELRDYVEVGSFAND
jgi:hypothetical protein